MRIAILFSFFLFLFFYFNPNSKSVHSDEVKVKVSAVRRLLPEKRPLQRAPAIIETEERIIEVEEEHLVHSAPESAPAEAAVAVTSDDLMDVEDGWKNELKDYLVNLQPDGEETYNSYLAEKEIYGKEIENISRTTNSNKELDRLLRELDQRHEEKLKDIFGKQIDEVKNIHSQYFESVQHLNTNPDVPMMMPL